MTSTRRDEQDHDTPVTGTYGAMRVRNRELARVADALERVEAALTKVALVLVLGIVVYLGVYVLLGR